MTRHQRILTILNKTFEPAHIDLIDDSASHAGHAGSREGGETHYKLTIQASTLDGLSRVQQHQKIYAVLQSEFDSGLHALNIKVLK